MIQQSTKFNLGRIYLTRGVNDLVGESLQFAEFVCNCIKRHARGDWGDLCHEDTQENERALNDEIRLFSAYKVDGLPRVWVITEANRLATTVLFPEEY
ncbi:hypothetical protein ACFL2J_00165 [Candidatus Omnitrophota bacterium]